MNPAPKTLSRFLLIQTAVFTVAFLFLPAMARAQVLINELFTNPAGIDTGQEWIELYNSGEQTADLTGWQINVASGQYFTFPSFLLTDKAFVLIHWHADGQNNQNELFTGTQEITQNIGNKSGFIAIFKNSIHNKDNIIDYFEYGEGGKTWESAAAAAGLWTAGQFVAAPLQGQSLGLKQDGDDRNLISDWKVFAEPTPGRSNIYLPEQLPAPPPKEQTQVSMLLQQNKKEAAPIDLKTQQKDSNKNILQAPSPAVKQTASKNENINLAKSAAAQTTIKNSQSNRPILILGAVAVSSFLMALALVWVKRKFLVDSR